MRGEVKIVMTVFYPVDIELQELSPLGDHHRNMMPEAGGYNSAKVYGMRFCPQCKTELVLIGHTQGAMITVRVKIGQCPLVARLGGLYPELQGSFPGVARIEKIGLDLGTRIKIGVKTGLLQLHHPGTLGRKTRHKARKEQEQQQ